ncbi:MAG: cytochrome oxidase subunit III [Sphingobacteriales bacterium]|nr:MAG: cytochrome oxidase subunit III [Sphingobacteriales bacterium]
MANMAAQIQRKPQYSMESQKFTLWVFLVTVTMLFAAFTSAMIVGREDAIATGKWQFYDIPFVFTISTIIIVMSSVSMQWAYITAKRNDIENNRRALWITLLLGLGFVATQIIGYKTLIANEIFLAGNNRGASFFYVISGVHLLHIIAGVFILIATIFSAYKYRVHSKNLLRINLCTTYWHFIGVLWVYLFALLSMFR